MDFIKIYLCFDRKDVASEVKGFKFNRSVQDMTPMYKIRLNSSTCRKLARLYAQSCKVGKEFAGIVFSSKNHLYRVDYIVGDENEVSVKRVFTLVKKNKMFIEFLWHTHHISKHSFSQQDLKTLKELKIPISLISEMPFKFLRLKTRFLAIIFVYDQPFVVEDFMGAERSIEYMGFHLVWIPLNPILRVLQKVKHLFFGRPPVKGFIEMSEPHETPSKLFTTMFSTFSALKNIGTFLSPVAT